MRFFKSLVAVLLLISVAVPAFSQEINVCIKVRGNTGLEGRLENIMAREFKAFEHVKVTKDRSACQLYLDLTLVVQEPIRFYGLGISIAYHVRGEFYSRPTSDVAQFGEDRMEDICKYLAKEIDKAFLEPLRHPGSAG